MTWLTPARNSAVDHFLDLAERLVEVLFEPRGGFARDERLAGDVGGGRRELEHERVAVAADQPAEAFGLRDVAGSVEVEPVGGRAVRLVAGEHAVLVRPVGPRRDEFFEDQVGDGFAVVVLDAGDFVAAALAGQFRQMILQAVAATLFELGEEVVAPVAFVFVGVVELGADALGRRREGVGTVLRLVSLL